MSVTSTSSDKGKEKAIDLTDISEDSDSEASSTSASSSSRSDPESDDDEPITQEYLNSLLEKARRNAALSASSKDALAGGQKEEILTLGDDSTPPIPILDPGKLPPSYFNLNAQDEGSSLLRDPDAERAQEASSLRTAPAPPTPPPEITKAGKPLTKRQKKELKHTTAGPDWFDLPAPAEADLPKLFREVEALRLRNQLDPKRFYRKEEGEGKGIKGLPKHFAIGTIIATKNPFGGASGENLTRAERKRTLVDELIDDAEAKRYAKKKFEDLQRDRGAKGRNTLRAKKAARAAKW